MTPRPPCASRRCLLPPAHLAPALGLAQPLPACSGHELLLQQLKPVLIEHGDDECANTEEAARWHAGAAMAGAAVAVPSGCAEHLQHALGLLLETDGRPLASNCVLLRARRTQSDH